MGHIHKLVVHLNMRRQGIGRQLLREGMRRLSPRNVQLHVDIHREPALQLYLSCGFEKIALRKDYYCIGWDAYVMEYSPP